MAINDDIKAAIACGVALYNASNKKIQRAELGIMLAIAGRESGWDPKAVQAGAPIGSPYVGVGVWQITPGTEAELDINTNARAAWALMERDPYSPYEPWNLEPDGLTLIYAMGTIPGGGTVREVPPSPYQYLVGGIAAGLTFPYGDAL
jgi:Transglycosylase SLT domain